MFGRMVDWPDMLCRIGSALRRRGEGLSDSRARSRPKTLLIDNVGVLACWPLAWVVDDGVYAALAGACAARVGDLGGQVAR
jgi:hypothetical protein